MNIPKYRFKQLIKENNTRSLRKEPLYLKENALPQGRTIINVDIQPEYQSGIHFNLHQWGEQMSIYHNNGGNVIFLYNGEDSLGMISLYDYQDWLHDECGMSEELVWGAHFYDKGYAFFRNCMDGGIDDHMVADLVLYMINNDITDSRDMDENGHWDEFMKAHPHQDVRDLMEFSDDCLWVPDLMDELKKYNNIVLTGGGINQCLKEVEIALMALKKPYNIYHPYTY
jgi:hypothetical protein